ncbi:MAG: Tungstate ABC transporter, substrate-binding protein [uncultured Chloroflexi bacterium]|uniref:Tungstate ABC transporter, substrate-binding protein n=1 Tax=uncultured Chloroflexota bacterium TaxID=166587 RepID=A0A6J4K3R5_9CHLR|nr:MAG: Tungstate ABC transporter, substrate-binding protein [uncultured Chloroflexota bacterium]
MADIPRARPGNEEVILATTTSTQDSGLLDVLVPVFERQTGYRVKPIAVGTGQSLALGARGEADVVLVHAPEAEVAWMAEGNGTSRLLVMHNDYVVVGPAEDPARTKGEHAAPAAFARIAQTGAPFVSRGDNSGTHAAELAIWKAGAVEVKGRPWYQESGQGMGATLNIANEKRAYTLTDRSTYLARRATLQLDVLTEGSKELLNVYHVMPVNPQKFTHVNAQGGQAFAAFMVSREAQETIATFGIDRYGQPLFFADAGKPEPAA